MILAKARSSLFLKGSDKKWWEGEDCEPGSPPEIICGDDEVFDRDDFEGRELSVVLEETEAEETDSDYSSGVDIDKVKHSLLKYVCKTFLKSRL